MTFSLNGTLASVIEALEEALRFFDGSPKKVLLDNAKQMVVEHLKDGTVRLNETFLKLADLSFIDKKENILLLGPPGVRKTHLAIGLGIKACMARYRVLFQSADDVAGYLYASLVDKTTGKKLDAPSRLHLLIIDELGYLRMDPKRANLFF